MPNPVRLWYCAGVGVGIPKRGRAWPARHAKPTERQLEAYNLRHSQKPLMSFDRIADKMGVTTTNAKRLCAKADSKLKAMPGDHRVRTPAAPTPPMPIAQKAATEDPQAFAGAFDALSTDLAPNYDAIAKECGIPEAAVKAIAARMKTQYWPLARAIGTVRTEELVDVLNHNAWRILSSITEDVILDASLRDRAVSAAVMIDKARLLENKPTQVLSIEDNRNLNDLIDVTIRALKKRGIEQVSDPVTLETTATLEAVEGTLA